MARKKRYRLVAALIVAILITIYFRYAGIDLEDYLPKERPDLKTSLAENGSIQLYFCPQEDCETAFLAFLDSAHESIHCALYEIDLESVKEKLLQQQQRMEVLIMTDDDYLGQFDYSFVKADRSGLMHNKFCVIDGVRTSTGSMNPTFNDAHKNNNNLWFINSPFVSQNYEDEFQELWNGTFKRGNPVRNPAITVGSTYLETYFCPEDHCAEHVKEELQKAKESIRFMTFSFTHHRIGNIILLKQLENISIKGVMEVRQIDEDSQYQRFIDQEIPVRKDGNKNNLHHKVFIIDEETVITGSFNPTKNGNERNDENLLIIKDKDIALRFQQEFERVWGEALSPT